MFLQRLADYAEQLGLPPPLYQERAVRYVIQLDLQGHYLHIVDCASQERKQGLLMAVPDCKRSVNIRPFLLADTAEYVLGVAREGSKALRVQKQHHAFVTLVYACAQQTAEPAVQAVARFLETLDLSVLALPQDFDTTARLTFEVDGGIRPIDLPVVQAYWATVAAVGDPEQTMQCLVCGQSRPAVERLPITIRGIPGGQSTGMALISANEAVFESYGLTASLIAPTCEACGQRFGNALNALLQDRETHFTASSLSYLFWSKEPLPFSVTTLLSETTPDDVQQFLSAPWYGRAEATRLETRPFYAAVLSARGPRVVLRDWMESTLAHVQANLRRYFALQRIVDGSGKQRWFPFWQLVAATVRRESKEDAAPQVGQALLHVALHGGNVPIALLQQVVRRIRAEHEVQPSQAACLKMVLLSQLDMSWVGPEQEKQRASSSNPTDREKSVRKETIMAELEASCPDPAYLCGRLLAVLEAIQFAALGDVNATIVDRYYGTASSAPASVFGRLVRGAQPHLAKLQRDKPGAFYRLDLQLQEILGGFGEKQFPRTLDVLSQGHFALGYYHQKMADRQARQTANQNRQTAGKPADKTLLLTTEVADERKS